MSLNHTVFLGVKTNYSIDPLLAHFLVKERQALHAAKASSTQLSLKVSSSWKKLFFINIFFNINWQQHFWWWPGNCKMCQLSQNTCLKNNIVFKTWAVFYKNTVCINAIKYIRGWYNGDKILAAKGGKGGRVQSLWTVFQSHLEGQYWLADCCLMNINLV